MGLSESIAMECCFWFCFVAHYRCIEAFEDHQSHTSLSGTYVYQAANDWICAKLITNSKAAKIEVLLTWNFPPVGWWKLIYMAAGKVKKGLLVLVV